VALGGRGQADRFNPALAGILGEDGSTPHADGHCFSNILRAKAPKTERDESHCFSRNLRAKARKTERDEKDAIGGLVSTASDSSESNRLAHCVQRGATVRAKKGQKKDMPLMWESSNDFLVILKRIELLV
jgi:hypothetical protein